MSRYRAEQTVHLYVYSEYVGEIRKEVPIGRLIDRNNAELELLEDTDVEAEIEYEFQDFLAGIIDAGWHVGTNDE